MKPLLFLVALLLMSGLVATPQIAAQDSFANATTRESDTSYIIQWMRLLYERVERERRNVPQAARIYGYAGVTVYEALRGAFPERPSLAVRLNDMPVIPAAEAGTEYDWLTVMNGALATVIPGIMAPLENTGRSDTMINFNTAEANATRLAIQNLANNQLGERAQSVDSEVLDQSFFYGVAIGETILAWASADGFADTRTMTAAYEPPLGEGLWVETTLGQHAMEPSWGELRPFVLPDADACAVPLDVPFDSDLDSTFHQQALEVRDMQAQLTDEQREIASFWDERVGESGTASGHWLYVMNDLADQLDMPLAEAAEMYALVGAGMADAFISAWSLKYQVNLLRPETYIQTYVDPTWRPLRQAPPFPAYPSGHAVLGGTVSEILTAMLGPVAYTDRYGVQYGMQARSYTSFEAAAYENALSRLYAGVHYRVDMENGLEQGRCIGRRVADLLDMQTP
ncbi:MAG: vanadium-dependent haloperoxidase [Chloroflexota bacterium]|nr:vanadium-dependent haloperoxidase [Chloroflexota bacterium]